ncbi:MAG: ComEC/Rec2 family competence protein [Leifsonia flava]
MATARSRAVVQRAELIGAHSRRTASHRIVLPAVTGWVTAAVLVGLPEIAWIVAVSGLAAIVGCAAAVVLPTRSHRGQPPGSRRGNASALPLIAVAVLAASLTAMAVAVRAESRTPGTLVAAAEAGRSITAHLTVTEKSVIDDTRARSIWDRSTEAGEGTAQRIRGTITGLEVGDATFGVAVPVLLFATVDDDHPVPIGSVLEATGVARLTGPGDAAAIMLFAGRPDDVPEVPPWSLALAAGMRSGFVERASALPGTGGELLPGLAVGDTTAVSEALDQAMKTSSLTHLTAVSGANCAVIVVVLTALLSVLGAPRWLRITGSLAGLGLFVVLVTPEPSVVRAALMALAVLLALAAGRPAAGLPVLSLVVLVVVISDPWLSRSYGFVLSALATAGLLTLSRPLARVLRTVLPRWMASAFAIPLAAQLACQPVLILLSAQIPVLGVPANLLAAPAAPLATLAGLVGCILTSVAAPVAGPALWLAWLPATWIAAIATTVHSLPFTSLPWLPGAAGALLLAGLTGVLITGIRALQTGRRMLTAGCCALLVVAVGGYGGSLAGQRIGPALAMPADWSHAACDVGQGDAVLVRSAGAVALIDTGADPALLTACLDTLSISRLDLLVLTHFDRDHVGGVSAVTGRAAAVMSGEPQNPADERILADLAARGAILRRAVSGDSGTLGEREWQALWPPARAGDTWVGNAGSVTLVFEPAQPGGIRSLFLGDLGEPAQERVLSGHRLGGPVDLVKMAHHGSADQNPRLYLAAAARIGLVSVGADNDYGHPTPAALDMLASAGTTPFRTDLCGRIVVGGTAEEPEVWTERPC